MRKLISTILIWSMVFSTGFELSFSENNALISSDINAIIFVDIPDNYWAKDDIYYFQEQGIISGVGNNKFDPNGGVTREQLATMLVKAFDVPFSEPLEDTFVDLSSDRWSYLYVETCKDFLTGYSNSFGGKPSFRPTEYATREDITVALVKMMGISEEEVADSNFAYNQFSDVDDISPQYLKYVYIAAENNLISGYPDGTFGADKSITRAEAVAIVSKATEQYFNNINKAIDLEVEVNTGEVESDVFLNIISEQGVAITVDSKTVMMSDNGDGKYVGVYHYIFTEEGAKTFIVQALKSGNSLKKEIPYQYVAGGPELKIITCPAKVTNEYVTLSGSMADKNFTTELMINGKTVSTNNRIGYSQSWSKSYTLKEGNNTFEFMLKNSAGEEVREKKIIVFESDVPDLKITSCPSRVTRKEVVISGTIEDEYYTTELTINGEIVATSVCTNYPKNWSKAYTLEEGSNTFEFMLKNRVGKEVHEKKVIVFEVGGPTIKITSCPAKVISSEAIRSEVTLSGSMADKNYTTELTINGELVLINQQMGEPQIWSKTYPLREGENMFEFVLQNSAGKEVRETKVVTLEVGSPELIVNTCPTKVNDKEITISGSMSDRNFTTELMINGEMVSTNPYTSFPLSWSKTYQLLEGENTFGFVLQNSAGKEVREVHTIIYERIE